MYVLLVTLIVFVIVLYSIPTDNDRGVDLGVILGNIEDAGKHEE
jgi:hypothetical protein